MEKVTVVKASFLGKCRGLRPLNFRLLLSIYADASADPPIPKGRSVVALAESDFGHSKGAISNTCFIDTAQEVKGRSGESLSGSRPGKLSCRPFAPPVRAE